MGALSSQTEAPDPDEDEGDDVDADLAAAGLLCPLSRPGDQNP